MVCSPGCESMYLAAEGKGGVTLSIDAICSARNVLLSAGKKAQADMVRKCLGWLLALPWMGSTYGEVVTYDFKTRKLAVI